MKRLHTREREERVKWLEAGRPRGLDNVLFRNYKIAKEEFRTAQRSANEEFIDKSIRDIEQAAECDIRLFWKLAKGKSKKQSESCQISHPNMVLSAFESFYRDLSIPKDNHQFDKSYTHETETTLNPLFANTSNEHIDILDDEIMEDELASAISSLKTLKAPGWDLVQNEHIIHGGDIVKKVLCKLFNKIIELEKIPDSWRKGVIIPIYKGHNKRKSSIDSYRPVTLLPVMLKIYEKLLYTRITSFLKSANIKFPNSQQQGFQPQLNCITTAYTVQEVIQYNIDRGSCTYAAFVDIKRAFDTVWHSALFVKLCNLGIRGKVWRIILDMYTSIESCVSLNRKLSSWFPVKQGVRQGSVLSTFLYLVFMNDLLDEIQNSRKGSCIGPTDSSCSAYVDDTVFLANSPNRLQDIVNIAFVYTCKNHFEIHPEKTFVTIFGKRLKTINQSIHIKLGERELPQKQSALHLGILQESSRSLNNTIKEACIKGRNSFFSHGVRPCGLNPKVSASLKSSDTHDNIRMRAMV